MKIYLSGPMSGIKDHNYPKFLEVARSLRKQNHQIESPTENNLPSCTCKSDTVLQCNKHSPDLFWQYMMRLAISQQLECSAWAGLEGWSRSRGSRREFDIAVDIGQRLYLVNWFESKYILEEFG